MAELVYALVLGTSFFTELGVRVSPAAPRKIRFAHNGAQHKFLILGDENENNIRMVLFYRKIIFYLPFVRFARTEAAKNNFSVNYPRKATN